MSLQPYHPPRSSESPEAPQAPKEPKELKEPLVSREAKHAQTPQEGQSNQPGKAPFSYQTPEPYKPYKAYKTPQCPSVTPTLTELGAPAGGVTTVRFEWAIDDTEFLALGEDAITIHIHATVDGVTLFTEELDYDQGSGLHFVDRSVDAGKVVAMSAYVKKSGLLNGPASSTSLATAAAMLSDIVSYWNMQESSGTRADLAGSNPLAAVSTASQSGPFGGNAALFDGSTSVLSHESNDSLAVGDIDFSIAFWLNISNKSANIGILGKWQGLWEFIVFYDAGADRIRFYVTPDGLTVGPNASADNFGSVNPGDWMHVVCWHDAVNNELGISVNAGAPNTTPYSTGVFTGVVDFRVGWADGTSTEKLNGAIDELGFWKRVLTEDDRAALYGGLIYPFG